MFMNQTIERTFGHSPGHRADFVRALGNAETVEDAAWQMGKICRACSVAEYPNPYAGDPELSPEWRKYFEAGYRGMGKPDRLDPADRDSDELPNLKRMTKAQIEEWSIRHLGFDPDRRRKAADMIADVEAEYRRQHTEE